MRRILLLVVCVSSFAVAGLVVAQMPEGAPKPGAEHQKLAYFAGTWASEGEIKDNPIMPAGKATSKDRCEWFEGKFAIVCHSEGKGPMGPMKGIGILSYNAEENVYTYYGVDNSGMSMTTVPRGSVQGDTWTYTDESMMGGKKIKSRYVIKELSPTAYTYKWELQGDGGQWMTVMEGKSTKTM
jgi:hypothetical protein